MLHIHNKTLQLALFARIVYLKDSAKENDPKRIANLALRLLQDRHLSVFEHQWLYIPLSDFPASEQGKVLSWLSTLVFKDLPVTYKNQVYFDKNYIAFTARTFLAGLELNSQAKDFHALPEVLLEYIKYQILSQDTFGYKLYFETENFTEFIQTHDVNLPSSQPLKTKELPEFGPQSSVQLITQTKLGTQVDAYTFKLSYVPITIVRQLVRHRFGVITEQSLRVVNASKRQTLLQPTETLKGTCAEDIYKQSLECYTNLVNQKFKKEDAREVLPLGTRTSLYWTVPKVSLDNYLELRLSRHAQRQHRILAEAIKQLLDT